MMTCEWQLDDPDHNAWRTTCGHLFGLEDGGPRDNLMAFCCYCGNPIKEVDLQPVVTFREGTTKKGGMNPQPTEYRPAPPTALRLAGRSGG